MLRTRLSITSPVLLLCWLIVMAGNWCLVVCILQDGDAAVEFADAGNGDGAPGAAGRGHSHAHSEGGAHTKDGRGGKCVDIWICTCISNWYLAPDRDVSDENPLAPLATAPYSRACIEPAPDDFPVASAMDVDTSVVMQRTVVLLI